MSVESLGYIGLHVRDPEGFRAFATGVLGLMVEADSAGNDRYRMDEYAWRLQVTKAEVDEIAFAGFEVGGARALEKMAERLRAGGIDVEACDEALCAERGVLGLIRCRDPEGLAVEIFYGPTLQTDRPFISPVGVKRFETGTEGLGHLAMASTRIEATRAFYRDLLGFVPTDEIHLRLAPDFLLRLEFLHCNSRHHTLALAPIPAPQRLQHVMLEASSIDDVGLALDRAINAGCTIAQSLGRHSNDRMLSFYVVSPAGFQFEFGFGAVKVDDATWSMSRHDVGSSWGHRPPAG
jgi:2,3-dihydroxybiphenyl 1,2-dioxygenase